MAVIDAGRRSSRGWGSSFTYSTPEHLALEHALIERIQASRGQEMAFVDAHAVPRAIATGAEAGGR
jgi:hypothetical protein